ncbi:MAG: HU family DNA-binding protein [Oscillospiraceae bacterium]|nr:HU family DNA-binding protein [Oscillospiraceae bacterium]
MNKAELVQSVAERFGITKKDAASIVDTVFGEIEKELVKKGQVSIAGFGTFATKERAARTGSNPATGQAVSIPAKTVPAFRASQTLKKLLAEK